ncbi:ceramide synthase 2-like isoform X2 [Protopterus annectens]|nr:ceramide synthase 2-like isoform X2 [Protopterus annectens]
MQSFLNEWLWCEEYWLPPGISWKDMTETDDIHYPQPRHLFFSVIFGLVFIVLRHLFERYVAIPLSQHMGVKEKSRLRAFANPVLETFYRKRRIPDKAELFCLSRQCNIPCQKVERWFRRRRNQDRPGITKKFCEASWRFSFYFFAFFGGLSMLFNKPWFWDQRECWTGYPQQQILPSMYWYYMTELAFYWSLLFRVAFDVKRKDFTEQIIHHIVTIVLIGFSYCANYIRVGSLVLIVHDASDFFLESAKMFNYAGWKRTCNVLFVIFSSVFFITRLVIFPSKVIYTTYYFSMEIFKPFFGYYFFNALLMILQLLHAFWAYLILLMVYKFIFIGKLDKDERSDVEESDDSSEEEKGKEKQRKNGTNGVIHTGEVDCRAVTEENSYSHGKPDITNGHLKSS